MSEDGRPAKRINVAVNVDEVAALELVIEREGVSLTEAVRRLVGYGEVAYRAAKVDGSTLLVRERSGTTREVVLLP